MTKFITEIINNTIETGIGQSIIAFAAWGYSFFLVAIVLYYAVLALIKLISGNKN